MRRMNDAMEKIMLNAMMTLALGMMALTTSTAQAGIPEEYGIPTGDGGYMVTYLVTGDNKWGKNKLCISNQLINTVNLIFKGGKVYCQAFQSSREYEYETTTVEGTVLDEYGSFSVDNGIQLTSYLWSISHTYEHYHTDLYAMGVDPDLEDLWFLIDGVDKIKFIADENGVLRQDLEKREDNGIVYGLGAMVVDYHRSNSEDPWLIKDVEMGYDWRLFTDVELTPVSPGYWGQLVDFSKDEVVQSGLAYYKFDSSKDNGLTREFRKNDDRNLSDNVLYLDNELGRCYIVLHSSSFEGRSEKHVIVGNIEGNKIRIPNYQIVKTQEPKTDILAQKYDDMPVYLMTVDAKVENAGKPNASIAFTPHAGDLVFDFDGRQLTNPNCSFCLTMDKEKPNGKEMFILPEILAENPAGIENIQADFKQGELHVYDLTGREIHTANPEPGIYICNGRKFIIK